MRAYLVPVQVFKVRLVSGHVGTGHHFHNFRAVDHLLLGSRMTVIVVNANQVVTWSVYDCGMKSPAARGSAMALNGVAEQ